MSVRGSSAGSQKMLGKPAGVGIYFQESGTNIVVNHLIRGGSAERSGKVQAGDGESAIRTGARRRPVPAVLTVAQRPQSSCRSTRKTCVARGSVKCATSSSGLKAVLSTLDSCARASSSPSRSSAARPSTSHPSWAPHKLCIRPFAPPKPVPSDSRATPCLRNSRPCHARVLVHPGEFVLEESDSNEALRSIARYTYAGGRA